MKLSSPKEFIVELLKLLGRVAGELACRAVVVVSGETAVVVYVQWRLCVIKASI